MSVRGSGTRVRGSGFGDECLGFRDDDADDASLGPGRDGEAAAAMSPRQRRVGRARGGRGMGGVGVRASHAPGARESLGCGVGCRRAGGGGRGDDAGHDGREGRKGAWWPPQLKHQHRHRHRPLSRPALVPNPRIATCTQQESPPTPLPPAPGSTFLATQPPSPFLCCTHLLERLACRAQRGACRRRRRAASHATPGPAVAAVGCGRGWL